MRSSVRGIMAGKLLLAATCGGGGEEIDIGTCLQRAEAQDGMLSPVDCDRPHVLEIVGILDAGEDLGDDWPGDAVVSRWAFQGCADAFEEYVGEPFGTSTLDLEIDGPTQESCSDGVPEVLGSAGSLDGEPLRGSISG